ncbi:glycosyltransferase family 39 protein [Ferrovibrio sp. MS7]|uniref:ArnT family glycosyltransferase n=1 Tax=Ferrovibrio plantarum TaxID=3119164 RepID=UPI003136E2FC
MQPSLGSRPLLPATFALWLLVVVAALVARPIMPIDETRYITVAWEMHLADHWLVPLLNGEAYHHKPPLLFWLIRLGWMIFGVSETWARLVAPLFGLGALGLSVVLARLLWPGQLGRDVSALAPLLLLTGAWWMLFATLTMFDLMMAFFALAGWIGLTLALRHGQMKRGLLLTGLAIGIGILAKGPVILVYVLPPALLAPLWADAANRPGWLSWYLGLLGSIVFGALIGLAWALPAAEAGGPEFKQALLWGQTAGRMKDSFAHKRGFFWYFPMLPLLLLPWLFWRPSWRALWLNDGAWRDSGLRFCLIVGGSGLLIFSAISGKQPHYLLPLAPAFALIVAHGLLVGRTEARRWDAWPSIAVLLVLTIALAALPWLLHKQPQLGDKLDLPDWALEQHFEVVSALVVVAVIAIWLSLKPTLLRQIAAVVTVGVGLFLTVHLGVFPPARLSYDGTPAALEIKRAQDAGRPVAFAGDYHGEYQFLGRLTKPLPEVAYRDIPAWFIANPAGLMVARYTEERLATGPKPVYTQPKRGRVMVIWDAKAVAEQPEFFRH